MPLQAPPSPRRVPAPPETPPPVHLSLSPAHTGTTRCIRPSLAMSKCRPKVKAKATQPADPIGRRPNAPPLVLYGSILSDEVVSGALGPAAEKVSGVLVPAAEEVPVLENFDDLANHPEVRDATMPPDAWQCIRCQSLNASSHCTNKRCGAKQPQKSDRSQTRHRQNIAPLRSHM